MLSRDTLSPLPFFVLVGIGRGIEASALFDTERRIKGMEAKLQVALLDGKQLQGQVKELSGQLERISSDGGPQCRKGCPCGVKCIDCSKPCIK